MALSLRPKPEKDRTAYLRDVLKFPITKDDLVPCVREMARLMIALDEDIAKLPGLADGLTNLQKLFLDFMADYLQAREGREQKEREQANVTLNHTAGLTDTQRRIKAIKDARQTLENEGVLKATDPNQPYWRTWFREKILPHQVNILLAIVTLFFFNALILGLVTLIYELIKARFGIL